MQNTIANLLLPQSNGNKGLGGILDLTQGAAGSSAAFAEFMTKGQGQPGPQAGLPVQAAAQLSEINHTATGHLPGQVPGLTQAASVANEASAVAQAARLAAGLAPDAKPVSTELLTAAQGGVIATNSGPVTLPRIADDDTPSSDATEVPVVLDPAKVKVDGTLPVPQAEAQPVQTATDVAKALVQTAEGIYHDLSQFTTKPAEGNVPVETVDTAPDAEVPAVPAAEPGDTDGSKILSTQQTAAGATQVASVPPKVTDTGAPVFDSMSGEIAGPEAPVAKPAQPAAPAVAPTADAAELAEPTDPTQAQTPMRTPVQNTTLARTTDLSGQPQSATPAETDDAMLPARPAGVTPESTAPDETVASPTSDRAGQAMANPAPAPGDARSERAAQALAAAQAQTQTQSQAQLGAADAATQPPSTQVAAGATVRDIARQLVGRAAAPDRAEAARPAEQAAAAPEGEVLTGEDTLPPGLVKAIEVQQGSKPTAVQAPQASAPALAAMTKRADATIPADSAVDSVAEEAIIAPGTTRDNDTGKAAIRQAPQTPAQPVDQTAGRVQATPAPVATPAANTPATANAQQAPGGDGADPAAPAQSGQIAHPAQTAQTAQSTPSAQPALAAQPAQAAAPQAGQPRSDTAAAPAQPLHADSAAQQAEPSNAARAEAREAALAQLTRPEHSYDTGRPDFAAKAQMAAQSQPAAGIATAPALTPSDAQSAQVAQLATAPAPATASVEAAQPQTAASQGAPMARSLVMSDREWPTQLTSMIREARDLTQGDIEISLQPERLGKMTIKMDMRDNAVSVTIVTENEASARLLNDNQNKLADLMAKAGLDLTQHQASSGQQGREGFGQNAASSQGGQSGRDDGQSTSSVLAQETGAEAQTATETADNGIDILA